jgi:hypothetical protein
MPPRGSSDISGVYDALAPWAVLATSVLTTCCSMNQFFTIDVLAMPQHFSGTIKQHGVQRLALIGVPKWFPILEGVIATAGGELYCKVKEITADAKADPQNNLTAVQFDLTQMPLAPDTASFTLSYSPWFRFVTEPVGFDVAGRVALYVAECFRFLFARTGVAASLTPVPDGCDLVTPMGLHIELRGMNALSQIRLVDGDADSTFDLPGRRIEIDRRMFPAIHQAASAMLETDDRLLNMTVRVDGDKAFFTYTPGIS